MPSEAFWKKFEDLTLRTLATWFDHVPKWIHYTYLFLIAFAIWWFNGDRTVRPIDLAWFADGLHELGVALAVASWLFIVLIIGLIIHDLGRQKRKAAKDYAAKNNVSYEEAKIIVQRKKRFAQLKYMPPKRRQAKHLAEMVALAQQLGEKLDFDPATVGMSQATAPATPAAPTPTAPAPAEQQAPTQPATAPVGPVEATTPQEKVLDTLIAEQTGPVTSLLHPTEAVEDLSTLTPQEQAERMVEIGLGKK